jgi:hypothetical protein
MCDASGVTIASTLTQKPLRVVVAALVGEGLVAVRLEDLCAPPVHLLLVLFIMAMAAA